MFFFRDLLLHTAERWGENGDLTWFGKVFLGLPMLLLGNDSRHLSSGNKVCALCVCDGDLTDHFQLHDHVASSVSLPIDNPRRGVRFSRLMSTGPALLALIDQLWYGT